MGLFPKDKPGQAIFSLQVKLLKLGLAKKSLKLKKHRRGLRKKQSVKTKLLRKKKKPKKLKTAAKIREGFGLKKWNRYNVKKRLLSQKKSVLNRPGSKSNWKRIKRNKLLELESENRKRILLGSRNSQKRKKLVAGAL